MTSLLFSSTHTSSTQCTKPPSPQGIYLDPNMDIFQAGPDGEAPKNITPNPGYDGDFALSPDGTKLVFTSIRQGALNLYLQDLSKPAQTPIKLTSSLGYKGEVSWHPKGTHVVYSAYLPQTPEQITAYKTNLANNLVVPPAASLHVLDINTKQNQTLWACERMCISPTYHPDAQTILFASDMDANHPGQSFALYEVSTSPTTLRRITYGDHNIDINPQFGPTSNALYWRSNRIDQKQYTLLQASLSKRAKPVPQVANTKRVQQDVVTLVGQAGYGRDPQDPQHQVAQDYILTRFKALGLEPGVPGYKQSFTATEPSQAGKKMMPYDATNLVAKLPANPGGQPTTQALLLGAHYDTLAGHPGADDNASGVAAMLAVVEQLKAIPNRRHDVYVVAFDVEEFGIKGSSYFTTYPPVHYSQWIAMFNFDMVGRMKNDTLELDGTTSAGAWRELVRLNQGPLKINYSKHAHPSDHLSFIRQGVPCLSFFTGQHQDYHTPNDTIPKLNFDGIAKVADFAARVSKTLLTSPRDLVFQNSSKQHSAPAPQASPTHTSSRTYFGTMPSLGQGKSIQGVLITKVAPNSPAQKAGLLSQDVIISFGGKLVTNPTNYMEAINRFKPGDNVEVVIKRKGKTLTIKATLSGE